MFIDLNDVNIVYGRELQILFNYIFVKLYNINLICIIIIWLYIIQYIYQKLIKIF